jgi:phosphoenolpyruvate synthase/pyruvate phosphate dikinase
VELANAVGKLGILRLEIRLSWMRFSHTITNMLLALGKEMNLDNILEIRMDEIRSIIERDDHAVTEEEIKRRQEAFLFLVENEEEKLFIGNEAISLKEKLVLSEILETLEIKGLVACRGIVRGKVFMIDWNNKNLTEAMRSMEEGAILVAGQTRPQLMPAIKKAAAIVTDEGGIMCHAAIVSRELNIPCIIGTKIATQVLKDGNLVEVDANEGIVRIIKN